MVFGGESKHETVLIYSAGAWACLCTFFMQYTIPCVHLLCFLATAPQLLLRSMGASWRLSTVQPTKSVTLLAVAGDAEDEGLGSEDEVEEEGNADAPDDVDVGGERENDNVAGAAAERDAGAVAAAPISKTLAVALAQDAAYDSRASRFNMLEQEFRRVLGASATARQKRGRRRRW